MDPPPRRQRVDYSLLLPCWLGSDVRRPKGTVRVPVRGSAPHTPSAVAERLRKLLVCPRPCLPLVLQLLLHLVRVRVRVGR